MVRDNDLFYLFAIVGVHRRVFDGVSICDSSGSDSEDGSGVVAVKVFVVVLELLEVHCNISLS
jgi:hypothetical protein